MPYLSPTILQRLESTFYSSINTRETSCPDIVFTLQSVLIWSNNKISLWLLYLLETTTNFHSDYIISWIRKDTLDIIIGMAQCQEFDSLEFMVVFAFFFLLQRMLTMSSWKSECSWVCFFSNDLFFPSDSLPNCFQRYCIQHSIFPLHGGQCYMHQQLMEKYPF